MSKLVKRIRSMINPSSQRDREDTTSVSASEGFIARRKCHSLPRRSNRHSTARRSNSGLWNRLVTNVFGPEDSYDFDNDGDSGGAVFYTDSVNGSNYEISAEVS